MFDSHVIGTSQAGHAIELLRCSITWPTCGVPITCESTSPSHDSVTPLRRVDTGTLTFRYYCRQLNVVDDHGRTALHYACMGNRSAIVKHLLTEPQLECVRDKDTYGFTPLMYSAMKSCSVAVIRCMIADGYQGTLYIFRLFAVIIQAGLR